MQHAAAIMKSRWRMANDMWRMARGAWRMAHGARGDDGRGARGGRRGKRATVHTRLAALAFSNALALIL